MVNSRSGSASSPPRIRRPSAPVEKSPLTGLTPECRPDTACDQHAVADLGEQLGLRLPCPGARVSARHPAAAWT